MTVQEIHKHIWNAVIKAMDAHGDLADIGKAKSNAVDALHKEGRISEGTFIKLKNCANCVLCAIQKYCGTCPLGTSSGYGCGDDDSLYSRVTGLGDVQVARKIRDIDVLSSGDIDEEAKGVLENER